jgi:hypothetical protein
MPSQARRTCYGSHSLGHTRSNSGPLTFWAMSSMLPSVRRISYISIRSASSVRSKTRHRPAPDEYSRSGNCTFPDSPPVNESGPEDTATGRCQPPFRAPNEAVVIQILQSPRTRVPCQADDRAQTLLAGCLAMTMPTSHRSAGDQALTEFVDFDTRVRRFAGRSSPIRRAADTGGSPRTRPRGEPQRGLAGRAQNSTRTASAHRRLRTGSRRCRAATIPVPDGPKSRGPRARRWLPPLDTLVGAGTLPLSLQRRDGDRWSSSRTS